MKSILATIMVSVSAHCWGAEGEGALFSDPGDLDAWFQRGADGLSEESVDDDGPFQLFVSQGKEHLEKHNFSVVMSMFVQNVDDRIICWHWFSCADRRARVLLLSTMICSAYGDGLMIPNSAAPWECLGLLSEGERKLREEELRFVLQHRKKIAGLMIDKIFHLMKPGDRRIKAMTYLSKNEVDWNPLEQK